MLYDDFELVGAKRLDYTWYYLGRVQDNSESSSESALGGKSEDDRSNSMDRSMGIVDEVYQQVRKEYLPFLGFTRTAREIQELRKTVSDEFQFAQTDFDLYFRRLVGGAITDHPTRFKLVNEVQAVVQAVATFDQTLDQPCFEVTQNYEPFLEPLKGCP